MFKFGALCVLLALGQASAASEPMTLDQKMELFSSVCVHEPHGTMLADPFDCNSFIVCDHGKTSVKRCDGRLRYDPRLRVCNWPDQVQCGESPSLPPNNNTPIRCYGYDSVYFIADTMNCEKYYICANGIPYQHHCAPGVHWDYIHNQCDYPGKAFCYEKGDNNVEEPEEPEITEPEEDEPLPDCTGEQKFFPYPEDCSKYYICIGGSPFIMSCPSNYYWNAPRFQCDLPDSAKCEAKQRS
ncbi:probable chitinase 10 [Phlebotomus papatasi]|uniref:Chitin-binding type-2 domain-containing protein n=1 Tax=Phlebotomus papatasi TaxID=29031 RepID=A0A1B0D6Q7_PHLPP|nr:probable chitinase 10 [Phlebotomus papatasi]